MPKSPRPLIAAAALLAVLAAWPAAFGGRLAAADKFKLLFSDKPDDPEPKPNIPLRPNVEQKFYVYVKNITNAAEKKVKVELLAGDAPVAAVELPEIKADETVAAPFGLTPPPAAPPPVVPGEKVPAPKPPAPALEEVKGALRLRVLDGAGAPGIANPFDFRVSPPSDYIEADAKFAPDKNLLTVKVTPKGNFAGPRCKVELVLRPDRIPGLLDKPPKEGTRAGALALAGVLTSARSQLTLEAPNLEFSGGERKGLVFLTVDGWERAIIFKATFPSDIGQPGQLTRVDDPMARLVAPPVANPGAPLPVTLELDNLTVQTAPDKPLWAGELGIDLNNDPKFRPENADFYYFPGDRRITMKVGAVGTGGPLLLMPLAQDWKADVDVGQTFGERIVRVRVLDKAEGGAPQNFLPANRLDDVMNRTFAKDKEYTDKVLLDASPPEGVKLVNWPAKLRRGDPLPVRAVGYDPESSISKMVFYLGKPPDPAAPPPPVPVPVVKADGVLIDAEKHLWAATLDAPTDKRATFEVSVVAVNGVGLTASDTQKIELIDPPPPPAPGTIKGASIEGIVVEGGRPQPNLVVFLRDPKDNTVKDSVRTDAAGKYIFKDVIPGSYRVTVEKTTDTTRAGVAAQVIDGEKLTDVILNLQR
jgi:hypothetical protein